MNDLIDDVPTELLSHAEREVDAVLGKKTDDSPLGKDAVRTVMLASYLRGAAWMSEKMVERIKNLTGLPS